MKKLLALLLAASMLAFVPACGDDSNNDADNEEKEENDEKDSDGGDSSVSGSNAVNFASYISYTDGTTTTVICNGKEIGSYDYFESWYSEYTNESGSIQLIPNYDDGYVIYVNKDHVKKIEISTEDIFVPDNGTKFAYLIYDYSAGHKLYVYDTATDTNTLVHDNMNTYYNPTISPNLNAIMFQAKDEYNDMHLYLYLNGALSVIPNGYRGYGLSDNGEYIYYADEYSNSYVVSAVDGKVPEDASPTLIYDGEYMSATVFNDNRTQLIFSSDDSVFYYEPGKELKCLVDGLYYEYPDLLVSYPNCPDTTNILDKFYEIDNACYYLKSDGTAIKVTDDIGYSFQIDTDCDTIYIDQNGDLIKFNVNTDKEPVTIIDDYCYNFTCVNDKGVFYTDNEDNLYYYDGSESTKLAEDAYSIKGTPNGTAFYECYNGFFMTKGKNSIKIFDDGAYNFDCATNLVVFRNYEEEIYTSNGGSNFVRSNKITKNFESGVVAHYYN